MEKKVSNPNKKKVYESKHYVITDADRGKHNVLVRLQTVTPDFIPTIEWFCLSCSRCREEFGKAMDAGAFVVDPQRVLNL